MLLKSRRVNVTFLEAFTHMRRALSRFKVDWLLHQIALPVRRVVIQAIHVLDAQLTAQLLVLGRAAAEHDD